MLTQDEIERRRSFITASDIAPILGRSPWANAADVWLSKINGSRIVATNEAIGWGNRLEMAVLEKAGEQLGQILPGDWLVHENGINACSLDGRTVDGEPVEAKTSGIIGPGSPHQWGESGTDEAPEYYLLQLHAQLLVTGAKRGWLAALIGGRGFCLYCVRFDQRIADFIRRTSEQFWNEHVLTKVPPPNVVPRLETLKSLRRVPNKTVPVDPFLVQVFEDSKRTLKEFQETANDAQAQLIAALGDAEAGEYPGGQITFFEQTRKAHEVKESTYRVLRIKPNKKALVTT